jgi:glutaredoxin 3
MALTVTVYTMTRCPHCQAAKGLLASLGIAFEEINLDAHPERWEECERRSGRATVPQIFWGDRHLGGADDLMALKKSGELARLAATLD